MIVHNSKPALQSTDCILRRGPYYSLALEIAEHLDHANRNGHNIAFQLISAHCGVTGNKQAATEARTALYNASEVCIAFSQTERNALLCCIIRNSTLEHWTQPGQRHQQVLRNEISYASQAQKKSQTSMVQRIQLGIAFTRLYRHLIGCCDTSPNCEHCQGPKTLDHIFCICPAYAQE